MNIVNSTKSFTLKCKRVWMALRKPSKAEFVQVVKISGIGIVAIGIIGFLISITMGFFI